VAGEGPKNTSKIKSRRRPNPRVASLYSILFGSYPTPLAFGLIYEGAIWVPKIDDISL
jgi:hypothetical protein